MDARWAELPLFANLASHAVLLVGVLWCIALPARRIDPMTRRNGGVVAVTHLLTALVLLLAPFAEEPWLEEQYGEAYLAYRRTMPRYL